MKSANLVLAVVLTLVWSGTTAHAVAGFAWETANLQVAVLALARGGENAEDLTFRKRVAWWDCP
jgi:hypothetical protein